MLDNTTKRNIDSARNILVGKVPDPKAQVEQITTALIYKFMDDMDLENEEAGLSAQFFVEDYAKYSWRKLMDNRLSGQERMDLYVEAVANIPKSKNIPQLFRDIFKGAFLPFRDPRTLSLFLKEINEFSYDNSENLGNAFEYLLSILGSQGDAGQFRTPRHIIDFIVEAVNPKKNETILDPACGTAGFLISAYKHIIKANSSNFKPEEEKAEDKIVQGETATETIIADKINYSGDLLSPDDKTKLTRHIAGYDISPDMVKLALVNLYLHGFSDPKIYEYDTLSSDKRWDETFDVVLANPPFMTPKGGIVPHKRFSIQANRAEVLFVDYIAEHLSIKGRAGIIVPEGIIFQSAGAYKNLRKNLIENWGLYAVVSLPSGVFQPYSGVKTSILLMDREFAKRTDEILFLKVENDGFDLGAQRRKIDKNDLPTALEILEKFKEKQYLSYGDFKNYRNIAFSVPKIKISENGDYNLTGERYKVDLSESLKANFETIAKALEPHQKIFKDIAEHHKIQAEEIQKSIQPVIDQFNKQQEIIKETFSSLQEPIKQMQKAFEGYDFSKLQELAELAKNELTKNQWPMVALGELEKQEKIQFLRGQGISKKEIVENGKNKCIHYGEIYTEYQPIIKNIVSRTNYEGKIFSKRGDVLVPSTTTADAMGIAIARSLNEDDVILGGDINIIRTENKYLLSDYLALLISTPPLKNELATYAKGVNILHISNKDIKNLQIPLPSLEVQEQIVAEIEQYQKVIDGASQVVKNWKPNFRIDPSWEMVELGEVCEVKSGGTPKRNTNEYWNGNIPWVGSTVCKDKEVYESKEFITDLGLEKSSARLFKIDTTLIALVGATIGKTGLLKFESTTNQNIAGLYPNNTEQLNPIYLYLSCQTLYDEFIRLGDFKMANLSFVKSRKIPLLPLEVQKQIVAEIQSEQRVVNANKELIEKMEKKVEAKIGEVWGEEI